MKVFVVIALFMAVAAIEPDNVLNREDNTPHFDCQSLKEAGYSKNGTYRLNINGTVFAPCRFTSSGAFTIFLYRTDAAVNWDQSFKTYQMGFGSPLHDFFMGLESIHQLTYKFRYSMTVGFLDTQFHEYSSTYGYFKVDHTDAYTLHLDGKTSGGVIPALLANNGMSFHTIDRPDRYNCALYWKTGWWYTDNKSCGKALPTGHYPRDLFWPHINGGYYRILRLSMYLQRY